MKPKKIIKSRNHKNPVQTYDTYKDSGIEWLGNIPEHWINYRIDWIGAIVRGNTGLKKDELLDSGEYVALQYGKTYKVDEVNNDFNFFVNSEYYKKNQVVNCGDTILISTSETIEDLGHSCFYNRTDLGLLGGEQILLKPNRKLIFEKYLYYYSKYFCGELKRYATGLKVFRFNIDDLKKISIAIPLLKEQTTIAAYLDRKTKAIDKKVILLTKKTEKYKELRKAIINQTVTKGLDKTVQLKDSGIEWIGEIPMHWEVKRFKDVTKIINGYAFNSKEYLDNGFPIIRIGDIQDEIVFDNTRKVSKENASLAKDSKIEINDILMAMTGATIGKNSFYTSETTAFLNQRVCSFRIKNYIPLFVRYFINSTIFQAYITLVCGGSAQENISKTQLDIFPITIPPLSEQTDIANYLDEKTSKIDAIVNNIEKQINTLKELRKTLINDVVTGKIRVINIAAVYRYNQELFLYIWLWKK